MNKNFNNIVQALRNNEVNEVELAKINSLINNSLEQVTKDLRENGFHSSAGNPKDFRDEVVTFLAVEYKERLAHKGFWSPTDINDIRTYQLLVAREYVVLLTKTNSTMKLAEKRILVSDEIRTLATQ